MPVTFKYRHPDVDPDKRGRQPADRALRLRLNPNAVNWNYHVNTAPYDTYGGQVLQVLSVEIDKLIIEGQLGREGPFGLRIAGQDMPDPRWGGQVPKDGFVNRDGHRQFDYNGNVYPGLHAMVEYFREYFAIVSQGGDPQNPGKFIQIPMTLSYGDTFADVDPESGTETRGGARTWLIVPTSFPSFRRSNEEFAPEWRVECSVVQADKRIVYKEKQAAISRLQEAIGYRIKNPFSDPLANPQYNVTQLNDQLVSRFKALLPAFTTGDLDKMIWQNVTLPSYQEGRPIDKSLLGGAEYLQGEIGNTPQSKDKNKNPKRKDTNQDK